MPKKNEAVGHWAKAADNIILAILYCNPEKDRMALKRLIRTAYPFGERAMHPYKIWLERVKYHLDCKFGHEPGEIPITDFEAIWNSKIK